MDNKANLSGYKADNWGAALFYGPFFIAAFQLIFIVALALFFKILKGVSDNFMAILGIPSLVVSSVSVSSLDPNFNFLYPFFCSLLVGLVLYALVLLDTHK